MWRSTSWHRSSRWPTTRSSTSAAERRGGLKRRSHPAQSACWQLACHRGEFIAAQSPYIGQPHSFASRFSSRHDKRGNLVFTDGHAEALAGDKVVCPISPNSSKAWFPLTTRGCWTLSPPDAPKLESAHPRRWVRSSAAFSSRCGRRRLAAVRIGEQFMPGAAIGTGRGRPPTRMACAAPAHQGGPAHR